MDERERFERGLRRGGYPNGHKSHRNYKNAAMSIVVEQTIINAYEIRTGLSRAKLSHLMDDEMPMNINQAIALGFANGVLTDEKREQKSPPTEPETPIKFSTGGERKILLSTSDPSAVWTDENKAITESAATFSQTSLSVYKQALAIRVSNKLLADNVFNLDSYITAAFARAEGIAEEQVSLTGNGTNK
jgi:hypothetical protein